MLLGTTTIAGLHLGASTVSHAYLGATEVFGKTATIISSHVGTTAAGNNTAPTVTIPTSASIGDIAIVYLTLNNADLITSTPTVLHEFATGTTTGQFTSHIYWCLIDGNNVNPGTVLTWAMSGTRAWTFSLETYTGVNTTNPIHAAAYIETSGSTVTPTITTTATAFLFEAVGMKPASGVISAITPPTGWTGNQFRASASSYQPATTLGSINTNPVPAGTHGGETWTPDVAANPVGLYTVALNPA